jgi:hypothetical protein
MAIVAYQGKQTLNFNDARFDTFMEDFRAQYYEIWIPIDIRNMGEWYLKLAYLNIFRGVKEYVCLHCDPEENDSSGTKSCYKQSPHLHLKIEHHGISKSHIALAHGYLDQIYTSEIGLFTAIKYGVELISDEILPRYEE